MFSANDTNIMSSFEMQSAPVLATTMHVRTTGKIASKRHAKLKKAAVLLIEGKLFLFMFSVCDLRCY